MPIRRGSIHRDPDIEYKLSQIEIDRDKNWAGKGITNIKEVSDAMLFGDIAMKGITNVRSLEPGFQGYVLVSQGLGRMPQWAAFSSEWIKFFGAQLLLSQTEAIVTPDHTANASASLSAPMDYSNDELLPTDIDASVVAAIVVPDETAAPAASSSMTTTLSYAIA